VPHDNEAAPIARRTTGEELRAAPRFTLLIRVGKLIIDGCECLCIIRDASATGAKVRLFAPLPASRQLALELGNGDRLPADIMWQNGDYAGLRFHTPIVVDRLLSESSQGSGRRQVRVHVLLNGRVHSGGDAIPVVLRDLSQQGARIECDKWLMKNELVRLETPFAGVIHAKVRWRNPPHYGLVLEQTFRLEEFARMVATLPGATRPEDEMTAIDPPARKSC